MHAFARNWWVLVLRGALAIVFGLVAFFLPGVTLAVLVIAFGAYAVVDGIFSLLGAVRPGPGESRWLLVILGLLSLLAGIVVLTNPAFSAIVLLYVIAAWAIASGVASIVAAISLRKVIQGEWLLAASGVLSVLLGIILVTQPAAGAVGMMWAIALYAITAGITLIALGVRLRSWGSGREGSVSAPAH